MNITKAQYYETHEGVVNVKATIDGVEVCVPQDSNNRHYAAILAWVAEGNTIAEAD